MMKITQMPVTVTLGDKAKEEQLGWNAPPGDLHDLPTHTPISVFGWFEFVHPDGLITPCWLLLGKTGIHPVDMRLVGNPMSWDEEVTG